MPNDDDYSVLLVDWENLTGSLIERNLATGPELVESLVEYAKSLDIPPLTRRHFAAKRFDASVQRAMNERVVEEEEVGTSKEQADIQLAVLAMDYLYKGASAFVLVTGDQDFIPLIKRLVQEHREVIVVVGDKSKLNPELERTLRNEKLPFEDAADVLHPKARVSGNSSEETALLALIRLMREGMILGGPNAGRNANRLTLLAQWGALSNAEEQQEFDALIKRMCSRVERRNAAVRQNDAWFAQTRTRTYLNFNSARLNSLVGADHLIRRIASRSQGLSIAELRTGPYATDDGTRLEPMLQALVSVGLIRREPGGTYVRDNSICLEGLIEPLWRVAVGCRSWCYFRGENAMPHRLLFPELSSRGVGQGQDSKSAGRVNAALAYARAVGVIDEIAADGQRLFWADFGHPVTRQFEHSYMRLAALLKDRLDEPVSEKQLLEEMKESDANTSEPTFGWDDRDRHRLLRVLHQSKLGNRNGREEQFKLLPNPWLDGRR